MEKTLGLLCKYCLLCAPVQASVRLDLRLGLTECSRPSPGLTVVARQAEQEGHSVWSTVGYLAWNAANDKTRNYPTSLGLFRPEKEVLFFLTSFPTEYSKKTRELTGCDKSKHLDSRTTLCCL